VLLRRRSSVVVGHKLLHKERQLLHIGHRSSVVQRRPQPPDRAVSCVGDPICVIVSCSVQLFSCSIVQLFSFSSAFFSKMSTFQSCHRPVVQLVWICQHFNQQLKGPFSNQRAGGGLLQYRIDPTRKCTETGRTGIAVTKPGRSHPTPPHPVPNCSQALELEQPSSNGLGEELGLSTATAKHRKRPGNPQAVSAFGRWSVRRLYLNQTVRGSYLS
jgi:hypothetical protein